MGTRAICVFHTAEDSRARALICCGATRKLDVSHIPITPRLSAYESADSSARGIGIAMREKGTRDLQLVVRGPYAMHCDCAELHDMVAERGDLERRLDALKRRCSLNDEHRDARHQLKRSLSLTAFPHT